MDILPLFRIMSRNGIKFTLTKLPAHSYDSQTNEQYKFEFLGISSISGGEIGQKNTILSTPVKQNEGKNIVLWDGKIAALQK